MFKVETKNDKYYVIPTVEHILENFDRFSFPYDSNWEIYKLFGYEPEDFFKFIISVYEAHVVLQFEFPWVSFYFDKYSNAETFKNELENRATKAVKNPASSYLS